MRVSPSSDRVYALKQIQLWNKYAYVALVLRRIIIRQHASTHAVVVATRVHDNTIIHYSDPFYFYTEAQILKCVSTTTIMVGPCTLLLTLFFLLCLFLGWPGMWTTRM